MRGEVIKADDGANGGVISGSDEKRYSFSQSNVRDGALLVVGHSVDFIAMGDEARDVYLVQTAAVTPDMPPQGLRPVVPPDVTGVAGAAAAVPAAGIPAAGGAYQQFKQYAPPYSTAGEENLGMWAYFMRAMTGKYVDFNTRARRKEYWSFVLFNTLIVIGFYALGMTFLGLGSGGFENDSIGAMGVIGVIFLGLLFIWMLATLVPGIAIAVRRLHDQNQSGWMYLLSLIPYVGGLILFVFMVLDSKPGRNIYGVSPKYPMGEGQVGTFD